MLALLRKKKKENQTESKSLTNKNSWKNKIEMDKTLLQNQQDQKEFFLIEKNLSTTSY